MCPDDKKKHEFFLSEISWPSEEAAGYIVELMRSASHIQDFQKLMGALMPPESDDLDELANDFENDSLCILVMNFAASQLRESLKLFSDFSKLPSYLQLQDGWSDEKRQNARFLSECVGQFGTGAGLLSSNLKPLRDMTFHYKPSAAQEWVRLRMEQEKDEKPPVSRVHLWAHSFGPGLEYDESIYSRHLFWGAQTPGALLAAQAEVWTMQGRFLDFVQALTKTLLKKSNVPSGREFNWIGEHRYGFKSEGECS